MLSTQGQTLWVGVPAPGFAVAPVWWRQVRGPPGWAAELRVGDSEAGAGLVLRPRVGLGLQCLHGVGWGGAGGEPLGGPGLWL